jgi:hypothetical protein
MTFKELLPSRIPEAVQGDNELHDYLEVAGELFDLFTDQIKEIDHYHDATLVPEKRLKELAAQFAMNFPRNLSSELQRVILRDLEAIYQKSGTTDIIEWIFRLIGWDIDIEYAWVLNPEYYDPSIKDVFELDDYDQEKEKPIITNFYSRDYRSFVLGEEYVYGNGTYFRGRKFFDLNDTFLQNEIVGEHYDIENKTRTADKVMKTPYLFIRVNEETYNIFISPYVDDATGEVYKYTEAEFFSVVENMFNFFLFDALRPTNVRVVIIVTAQYLEDQGVISDNIIEQWVAEPLETYEDGVVEEIEQSILFHQPEVGFNFLSGAPPSPFNKDMVISAIGYRNLQTLDDPQNQYIDGTDNNYIIIREEDYPVVRCGSDSFRFVTPHEEVFDFRSVITSEQTELNPVDASFNPGTYLNDLGTLALNVDFTTDTFGIIDAMQTPTLIIRNTTTITSPCFNSGTRPTNAFDIGGNSTNQLFSMDFRQGGSLLADTTTKTFWYLYDMTVYYKENNIQDTWDVLMINPTQGDLNMITTANTVAFVFNEPIPYDFVLDIRYEAQPEWENRY